MALAGSLQWAGKVSAVARQEEYTTNTLQSTWLVYATWLEA